MNDEAKLKTLLGFAAKAGNLTTGTAAVERAIIKRKVFLVICARDLAVRTLRNFQELCQVNEVDFYCYGTREEVGKWIGLPERGIVGITSRQFAMAIQRLFIDRGE